MKKMIYWMLALFICSAASMNAQVAIGPAGSDPVPHAGAVLDLQSNSTRGLLLPKVELVSAGEWGPVSGESTPGMMVYNIGTAISKGVYVWVVDDQSLDGKWKMVSGGISGGGSGATALDGAPTDWLTTATGVTGSGLVGDPYAKACPEPEVTLTLKEGYSFGAVAPGGAAAVSGSSITFTASGVVVITKDNSSSVVYVTVNNCPAVDPEDYTTVPTVTGEYSLGGNFCYDVFKSDGGTTCGNLSERSNSFTSGYEFTYTLTTTAACYNLQFFVEDKNTVQITEGMTTDQSTKKGVLKFASNIKNLFTGGEKKTITVYALFEDSYGQRKKVAMEVLVQDCWCCGAKTLKSDGLTYGWLNFMCYNLGAEDSNKDPFAYGSGAINGDLYQWGRPKDGHQSRTSSVTATLSPVDVPNHAQFIKNNTTSPYDWRSGGSKNTLWGDGSTGEKMTKGVNDPCPTGWKVPSLKQWQLLLKEGTTNVSGANDLANGVNIANKWVWTGNGYKVGGALYLPAAGIRSIDGSSPTNVGSIGYYWTSTVSGSHAWNMYFGSTSVYAGYMSSSNRSLGLSVRCVAE